MYPDDSEGVRFYLGQGRVECVLIIHLVRHFILAFRETSVFYDVLFRNDDEG